MRAWLLLIVAGGSGAFAGELESVPYKRAYCQGGWYVVASKHFQVCAYGMDSVCRPALHRCEELRTELAAKWLGLESLERFPICQVILHPNRVSYLKHLGPAANGTAGSSVVGVLNGRLNSARIDLCMACDDVLAAALPHEMTHVILACAASSNQLPCWAEEGIAVLADPAEKRSRHRGDLHRAWASQQCLRLPELLSLSTYPPPARIAAFYGQSLSLVEFLMKRGGARQFMQFLQQADEVGYDRALIGVYQIDGVAALERQWLADITPEARLAMLERN